MGAGETCCVLMYNAVFLIASHKDRLSFLRHSFRRSFFVCVIVSFIKTVRLCQCVQAHTYTQSDSKTRSLMIRLIIFKLITGSVFGLSSARLSEEQISIFFLEIISETGVGGRLVKHGLKVLQKKRKLVGLCPVLTSSLNNSLIHQHTVCFGFSCFSWKKTT